MKTSWKLIEKPEFSGGCKARLEKVVIFKHSKGVYIYVPAKLKKKLHNPKYYNLYVRDTKIMLQFTEEWESYTRKFPKCGSLRLPLDTLGLSLRPIVRENLESEIHDGNLFIDLKLFVKEKMIEEEVKAELSEDQRKEV